MDLWGLGFGGVLCNSAFKPRGSIDTTIVKLGPRRPSLLWFWGPNSIIVVYMDPLGKRLKVACSTRVNPRKLEHGFRRISARIPYTLP